ncbi:hypothetical protein [Cellulophaga baltica]|uniref:hypothetical protein n=1 Tax=Cellulophaga baltica TaxID=76594 RepID=UPI002495464B|nr:hypothetical protein [Cellulophaga baltica]
MSKKIIINLSVLLAVIFIVSFFFSQYSLIKKLEQDSVMLKVAYIEFQTQYFDSFPTKKEDVKFMLDWLEENDVNYDFEFDKLGYNIKYDSIKQRSYVYCFGIDKIDNRSNYTPFNSLSYYPEFVNIVPLKYNIFYNYFKSSDILLLDIKKTNIICSTYDVNNQYDYFAQIQLYNGVDNLIGSSYEVSFKNSLLDFCQNELGTNFSNKKEKLSVMIYSRNGEVEIVCQKNLSYQELNNIKEKLINYILKHKINYFDYAYFSLYINS